MSGNLIDLRKRVNSVKNTQKITRAMKTVSAAKLRRATGELAKSGPFMEAIERLLQRVGGGLEVAEHPLFKSKASGYRLLVIVSSDKGLCGAFNSHVIRRAEETIGEMTAAGEKPLLITVGNKVCRYFEKRDHEIKAAYRNTMVQLQYGDARKLSHSLQEMYTSEEIKSVDILYTQFISASRQEIGVHGLFPLQRVWGGEEAEGEEEVEYIYEPDPDELFRLLLPKYVDSTVYRMLRESEASEHAARMIAMDLATRNAKDMIRSLTLRMNKVRQASITGELLEIITATEALRKR
jgi:F-type H+-transporting ATPase subunit gamma